MPAPLEPIRRVQCTYKDCDMSFDTEQQMKRHKKHSDEHEYCHKCDEDFDSFEDYAMHKITRPFEHGLACRVCGDEFKSQSGLKRHIEIRHKVNQKLTCIGCHKFYYSISLFIEHLEFGHCEVISPTQFQGHIVHKTLITELLKSNAALERFRHKTSKFDAAVDHEREGGVLLDHLSDSKEMESIDYQAIKPDTPLETPLTEASFDPYPPLPSKHAKTSSGASDTALSFDNLSLTDKDDTQSEASTLKGSVSQGSTTNSATKAWGGRNGKSSATMLFPNAKPTPPSHGFSVTSHDDAMEHEHGINIMHTRFWDPLSTDWNAHKFYDTIISKFHCPFICEQTFDSANDLSRHILDDHRAIRMSCPRCMKHFNSATALMAHCDSVNARCQINQAEDYNLFLDRISGGFLSVDEKIRPDHKDTKPVLLRNEQTGHMEIYKPPTANFLEYQVTTPPDWKDPEGQKSVKVGEFPGSK